MKIQITLKPNSKQPRIIESDDGSLIIYLKSPPVDGKANKELITILSKKYQVTKKEIKIKSGLSSRKKLIEISDL